MFVVYAAEYEEPSRYLVGPAHPVADSVGWALPTKFRLIGQ